MFQHKSTNMVTFYFLFRLFDIFHENLEKILQDIDHDYHPISKTYLILTIFQLKYIIRSLRATLNLHSITLCTPETCHIYIVTKYASLKTVKITKYSFIYIITLSYLRSSKPEMYLQNVKHFCIQCKN